MANRAMLTMACVLALLVSSLAGAAEVTLDLQDVPLPDAIEQFAQASEAPIRHNVRRRPWKDRRITLALDRVPFWSALDQFCEVAKCRYMNWGSGKLMISPGPKHSGPVQIAGPCRFEITHASRSLSYASGKEPQTRLSLTMQVMWESGWPVAGIRHEPQLVAADRADGTSLVPKTKPTRRHFSRVYRSFAQHMSVNLVVPDRAGGSLSKLEGFVVFLLATRKEEGVIEGILEAKGQSANAAELEVQIDSVEMAGSRCVISLTETQPQQETDENRQLRTPVTYMLVDAAGKTHHPGHSRSRGNKNQQTWTLQYALNGATPAKLVFVWQTDVEETEVGFEFENLPLP